MWASRNQSRTIDLNLETDYCVMRLSNGALLEIAMRAYTDYVLTAALNCHRIILLIRNYELLIRNYGLLIRNYELLIRIYGLLILNYELVIRNYELVIRNYELVIHNCELRNIYACQIWSRSDGRVEGGGRHTHAHAYRQTKGRCSFIYLYYYRRRVRKNLFAKFDNFLAGCSQFDSDHLADFMRLHVAYPRPFCHRFLRLSFVFTTKSIINNVAFRHILRCLRCTFRIYVATAIRQIRLIARWRNGRCRTEYGNVEGSEGRCKRPSRVRAGARCKKICE